MKFAVISDVHSNLEALTAALDAIDERGIEIVYCLGDVVGYGPDPSACVDLVRERCTGTVQGNHDAAVARQEGLSILPRDGRDAARHNRAHLSGAQLDWLAGLPLRADGLGCTFVHATPERPDAWKRLDSYRIAQAQFKHFETNVCFVGHTHIPAVMANKLGVLSVRSGHRYLINAGSVGQPRDQNVRLSFAVFDPETFSYEGVRVPYNVEATAEKIHRAGLPPTLAQRLKEGR